MTKIGKVEHVPLREVWEHEAHNFTRWLTDNIDVLEKVLGFELSDPTPEAAAGSFKVDIKAESEAGTVVVENQFESSNHKHLGQLLTYWATHDARTAVWIVENPQQEHVDVLSQLDEKLDSCDFYLLKADAIKIGASPPALLLTKIVGPNVEKKKITKDATERKSLRLEFWEQFLAEAKRRDFARFSGRPATTRNVISARTDASGVDYQCWINQNKAGVSLRVRDYVSDEAYEEIQKQKQAIEALGYEWEDFDLPKSGSFHKNVVTDGGFRSDRKEWPKIIDKIIEEAINFERATEHIIKNLGREKG